MSETDFIATGKIRNAGKRYLPGDRITLSEADVKVFESVIRPVTPEEEATFAQIDAASVPAPEKKQTAAEKKAAAAAAKAADDDAAKAAAAAAAKAAEDDAAKAAAAKAAGESLV